MSRIRPATLGLTATITLSTMLALPANPAGAAEPPTKAFVVSDVGTHVEDCPDVPFPVRHDADVHAVFQERLQHGEVHVSVRFWNRNTFTNEDTGATMYGMSHGHEVDRRVTENADGTLTITVELYGRDSYRTKPGGLVGIVTTTQHLQLIVDPMGTTDIEDDVVLSEELSEPEIRIVGDGGDLCDIAAEYLS
ncbi:hypothetical protein [Nocardioides sp.]|uniref:hypothetical protein n=1 Tax=Nocardioides sp. TaxID=35761 RepID=UPI002ED00DD8